MEEEGNVYGQVLGVQQDEFSGYVSYTVFFNHKNEKYNKINLHLC